MRIEGRIWESAGKVLGNGEESEPPDSTGLSRSRHSAHADEVQGQAVQGRNRTQTSTVGINQTQNQAGQP